MRLIYSYSLEDPVSAANIPWHGARRGSKSVSLLSSSLPPASFQDDDVRILEFRNRNVSVQLIKENTLLVALRKIKTVKVCPINADFL